MVWLITPDARTNPGTAEFSAPIGEIPQADLLADTTHAKSFGISRRRTSLAWSASCTTQDEHPVFRAALLSIVLTLAVGPTASLLCVALCHPHAVSAASCEHRDPNSRPSVAAKEDCPDIAAGTAALVREEVRRGVSTSDGQHAVVVPPFRFTSPPSSSAFGREPGQHPPLGARPLVLALRI
jgi:hypothetical protein